MYSGVAINCKSDRDVYTCVRGTQRFCTAAVAIQGHSMVSHMAKNVEQEQGNIGLKSDRQLSVSTHERRKDYLTCGQWTPCVKHSIYFSV